MIPAFRTFAFKRKPNTAPLRILSHLSDRQLLDIGLVRADLDDLPRWG